MTGFTATERATGNAATAPVDTISATGMTIAGNRFSGGTVTTTNGGAAVNVTGANTTTTAQGAFFGYDAAASAPDEVGGLFLHQGDDGTVLAASLLTKQRFLFDHPRSMLSALIWAGSFTVCGATLAQSPDESNISRLISTGQVEAARIALEVQNPSQADRVFFDGRILKAQRRFPEAINAFRQVLQIDPNYINARRELAHTLLLNRDYGRARFHFEELLKIDQNDQMRDGYRGFLNVMDQNKPIGFSGYFSILPSSNVNRGTTNIVFDTNLGQFVIDPNSQAESGVGVQLGFSGYFRHLTSPTSRISLNWVSLVRDMKKTVTTAP